MLLIFILFGLISTGEVFVTYYKDQDCVQANWADAFKMGSTEKTCTKTKLFGENYYFKASCVADKGYFITSYFSDDRCRTLVWNQTDTYFPDCGTDPEMPAYSMQGTCDYEAPATYSHFTFFPQTYVNQTMCNSSVNGYEVVMRPSFCIELPVDSGWGKSHSAQISCLNSKVVTMDFFSDKKCATAYSSVKFTIGECTKIPELTLAAIVSACEEEEKD